jgi:hypothetical protein
VAEENPFQRLGSLFGLGGNGNSGGWNPLSLLGIGGGAEKKDGQSNPSQHLASIANGFNGLMKDMLKGAAKIGEELSSTEAPTTTSKDPIVDGIGKLLKGFWNSKNKDAETLPK